MNATELPFSALLAIESNQWHYHIPRFQREYVWGKHNWSKLLEDIYDNDAGHYMGSIICVPSENEPAANTENVYEVVDGQQRLQTLSLLLAAIYQKFTQFAGSDSSLKENEDFIVRRSGIQKRLIKEVKAIPANQMRVISRSGSLLYCLRVQPSTQENNLEDYRYILKEAGVLPEGSYPKNAGNRRMSKAFEHFRQHTPDSLTNLYDLLDRISALSFIQIIERSQSKAFMLFETLNYRGVPLSAVDLIKNKMLSTLESKHAVSIDQAYDEWQKLLADLPEDQDQDRFLRQFYNAFKSNPAIKIEKKTRATTSNIIEIYETLIKRDAGFIFGDLISKAKIYNQFLEPEKYPLSRLTSALVELERISAAPSYTFLLYLFSLPEDVFTDPDVKEKTVELLCKYYFRRNVTDFPGTRDLDSINIDLIEQCQRELSEGRKLSYSFTPQVILAGKGKPAGLGTLKQALADNLFYNNENMARYALAKLDETSHTREYAPKLWARSGKGLYVWTVEHIFPQGANIPSEWVQMIANGEKDEAKRIQGEFVHCLGNLTLTGYNSKLSNQSFGRKQAKSEANIFGTQISIGYKNGLALNNIPFSVNGNEVTLGTADRWTLDHIKARNAVMVDMLIQLFKFDGE